MSWARATKRTKRTVPLYWAIRWPGDIWPQNRNLLPLVSPCQCITIDHTYGLRAPRPCPRWKQCTWSWEATPGPFQNDPASVFLSTHWWSQHPACQRCFGRAVSGGALAPEPLRATRSQPEPSRIFWIKIDFFSSKNRTWDVGEP